MVEHGASFCVFISIGVLIVMPLSVGFRLKEFDTRSKATSGWLSQQSLGVKLWTWNSGIKDLRSSAHRLFEEAEADPHIEVVAICQTEAEATLADFVEETDWLWIGHGEHWGWAGGKSNAQILSVFYRQRKQQKLIVNRPPRSEWKMDGKGLLKGMLVNDHLMEEATIPGVLSTTTLRHMNSITGKGGVSTVITLDATEKRATTSVALICGHLDSETASKRDQDFLKLLRDGSRRKGFDLEELRRFPTTLFDSREGFDQSEVLDAVIIFGDLNYRIARSIKQDLTDDKEMADFIVGNDRQYAALDDQLNPDGYTPAMMVRPIPVGLQMQCNQPHQKYLPTYKRNDIDACIRLDRQISQSEKWNKSEDIQLADYERELAKLCFVGNLFTEWKTKENGKFLQTGWLDRFCWRSVDNSLADVQLTAESAWHDVGGSDHVAATADLNIFHPSTYCHRPELEEGQIKVRHREQYWQNSMGLSHPPAVFGGGERIWVSCPEGKTLPQSAPAWARCGDGNMVNIDGREFGKPEQASFGNLPKCQEV